MGHPLEMKPLSSQTYYYDESFRSKIKSTAPGFLHQLEGLTVYDIKGKDTSRTRVVTTLIHGNEPSGFIAGHLWLRSDKIPTTNVRMIFCNTEAAQQRPIFTRRYVGQSECEDLNRYFGKPKPNADPALLNRAAAIRQAIEEVNPEAIIDLHNTSGLSPGFAVGVNDSEVMQSLTALFADKLIVTGLGVGSLMEVPFDAPVITIECGGANELMSHQVATDGLNSYFTQDELFTNRERDVTLHYNPIRIEVHDDTEIAYASHKLLSADITMIPDIEQFNRQPTPAGEFLGWFNGEGTLPLRAVDEKKQCQIDNLLYCEDGRIYAKQTLQMFMATTNRDIASNDCITYVTVY